MVERICCVCAKKTDRKLLIKVTYNKQNNQLMINPDSKFVGRSAYICKSKDCVDKAFKKNRLFKVLKMSPDETIKEKINTVLDE